MRARSDLAVVAAAFLVAVSGCTPGGGGGGTPPPGSPQISAVNPSHGAAGQAVTMDGANFETDRNLDSVFFGQAQAVVLSATTTEVVCQVPGGVPAGAVQITVTTRSGTSSAAAFTIDPQSAGAPSISSLSPSTGAIGAAVAILGTGFDPSAAGNLVSFNGTRASVRAATSTRIDTTVPSGATSGQVVVETSVGTSNGVTFTVTSSQPASQGNVGSMAGAFLTASQYTSMLVEVGYIQGKAPDQNALNVLQTRLNARCQKPGGIRVVVDGAIPDQGITTWALSDLARVEQQYRTSYSAGNTAVLYFLYVNGGYAGDTTSGATLGLSYTGSSIGVFKDNVIYTKGNPRNRSAVEDSVIVHEAGHNLGLVNIGIPMVTPHEDAQHPGHCSNQACVNYWAVDTNVAPNLLSTIPNDWDAACLSDMHAAGGK
jgi:hypothetical protein